LAFTWVMIVPPLRRKTDMSCHYTLMGYIMLAKNEEMLPIPLSDMNISQNS
jgi:hypothetical protein